MTGGWLTVIGHVRTNLLQAKFTTRTGDPVGTHLYLTFEFPAPDLPQKFSGQSGTGIFSALEIGLTPGALLLLSKFFLAMIFRETTSRLAAAGSRRTRKRWLGWWLTPTRTNSGKGKL